MTPKKILHVANFNTLKYGDAYYSVDRRLSNGLTRAGHFVYEFSHRDVSRTATLLRTKSLGRRRMNALLLETVRRLKPDLLLLGHTELVDKATLETIKARHRVPMAMWYVDPIYPEMSKNYGHLSDRAGLIDALYCTTGGTELDKFAQDGTRAYFFPNPVDPSVDTGRNFERDDLSWDLVYCGRDQHDSRRTGFVHDLRRTLGQADPEARFLIRGCLGNPTVFGAEYMETLWQARMGLSHSRRSDVCLYASDRIAHLMGNGLLTLSARVPGMTELFRKDEVAYYGSQEELVELVGHYRRHDGELRAMAQRGWQRAHAVCNATRVARFMLETWLQTPLTDNYEWQAIRC